MTAKTNPGIACGGNWIVDLVKVVDVFPEESSLANILGESMGGGGCAHNVILNLAKFDSSLALHAVGVIGQDAYGDFLWNESKHYPNIILNQLHRISYEKTSYTDVFNVHGTGRRTFFHYRGANQLFSPDFINLDELPVDIFHLGYLLLLDAMDLPDVQYQTVAARFLAEIQKRKIKTSIDLVSENSDRFSRIVPPALKYADYCIINDFESAKLTGIPLRDGDRVLIQNLPRIASRVLDYGAREFVIIHFPEGAYLLTQSGKEHWQPSLELPPEYIVGTTGAGDSFCAGVLYGLCRGWSHEKMLRFAACAGGMNLRDLTTTGGIGSWEEVLSMEEQFSYRKEFI
jgi:sugar/nucleoside kinase (ribokinase family)